MTPAELAAAITARRAEGRTWAQVAAALRVTPETLRVWRHRLGLPLGQGPRVNPPGRQTRRQRQVEAEYGEPLADVIRGLRALGYSWPTVAGALGISNRQLLIWRKQLGFPIDRTARQSDPDWQL